MLHYSCNLTTSSVHHCLVTEWHDLKIHITHTLGMYPVRVTLPQWLNNTLLVKVPQLLKYIYMVKYTFSCLMCPDEGHHYLQTSVSAYDIQFHHCHQCTVESYHNDRKSGYTDHCCIWMLHFDRKLQKFVREMSTAIRLQKLENSRNHEKLTAAPLISSVRACTVSITSWRGGDALAIGTLKLGGTTTYYV